MVDIHLFLIASSYKEILFIEVMKAIYILAVYMLLALAYGGNVVIGNGNCIKGDHNVIKHGDGNRIEGNRNELTEASKNAILGNLNELFRINNLQIHGDGEYYGLPHSHLQSHEHPQ